MNLPYRTRPGLGFVVFVATLLGAASFFAWGLRLPPLERVWQMQLELLLGERELLSDAEAELLQDVLARYPGLADNMLDDAASSLISAHVDGVVDGGYAYVVRRAGTETAVLVVRSPSGAELTVKASTAAVDTHGVASGTVPFAWILPNEGPFPQLIGVHLLSLEESTLSASARDSLAVNGGEGGRGFPSMRVEVLAGS